MRSGENVAPRERESDPQCNSSLAIKWSCENCVILIFKEILQSVAKYNIFLIKRNLFIVVRRLRLQQKVLRNIIDEICYVCIKKQCFVDLPSQSRRIHRDPLKRQGMETSGFSETKREREKVKPGYLGSIFRPAYSIIRTSVRRPSNLAAIFYFVVISTTNNNASDARRSRFALRSQIENFDNKPIRMMML